MNYYIYFPGIVGYKDIFLNSYNEIKSEEENNAIPWHSALTGKEDDSPKLVQDLRLSKNISFDLLVSKNEKFNAFRDILNNSTEKCLQDYSVRYGYWDLVQEGWVLLKYEVGHYFKNHTDSSRRYPRQVSAVYYINDDYSGGELEFPFLNISVKPSPGELLVFPSTNLFSHSANPVISGTKYSMANWYN